MASPRPNGSTAQTQAPMSSSSPRFASSCRFPLLSPSQPSTSSVSLAPRTAQGRPIPLSDTKSADRTTALRELRRYQPVASLPCTNTSGPPPTTGGTTTGTSSQPILVRTYSGAALSSTHAHTTSRRDAISGTKGRPSAPSSRRAYHAGRAVALMRPLISRKTSAKDDAKLPPLEAFSFKSIMTDIQDDIGTDLDRIADICARSRYSLSNQYEIHVAPHGSGAGFVQGGAASMVTALPAHNDGDPTLQATPIEDERAGTNHRRRAAARTRSTAYGTLETIISSSRSSDEDSSKTKSAAGLAAQVRGRIPHASLDESGSAQSTRAPDSSELQGDSSKKPSGVRRTLAGAIFDHSRAQTHPRPDPPWRRTLGASLAGEPVVPEASHSQLVSTTAAERPH
ncbi:hypothetical protein F5B17DRAFT_380732 [Nemania serpens]|nr:hypothetical protein F5B17DRAFT_380732 [Nemania serpens]